jgi:hypothetical protein
VNPGLTLSLHWWRGFSLSPEPTLFWLEFRLGFVTVTMERAWPLAAYRKLRATVQEAVARVDRHDEEGR